jgi:putative flippase GtrA
MRLPNAFVKRRWDAVERLIGVKTARYTMVSAISVVVTQIVLAVLLYGIGWSAALSNSVAVSIGALPSYALNRAWTWGKTGKNHLWKEVVPFWAMALLGLGFSTLLVHWASQMWEPDWVAMLANLAAFGILWVGKFFVLHFVLFKVVEPDDLPDAPPVSVS